MKITSLIATIGLFALISCSSSDPDSDDINAVMGALSSGVSISGGTSKMAPAGKITQTISVNGSSWSGSVVFDNQAVKTSDDLYNLNGSINFSGTYSVTTSPLAINAEMKMSGSIAISGDKDFDVNFNNITMTLVTTGVTCSGSITAGDIKFTLTQTCLAVE